MERDLISVKELMDAFVGRCVEVIRPIYRPDETLTYGGDYRRAAAEAIALHVINLSEFPVRYAYALHRMLEALQYTRPVHEDCDITDTAIEAAQQVCLDTLLEERDRDAGDRRARAKFLLETVRYNEENGHLVWTVQLAQRVCLDVVNDE